MNKPHFDAVLSKNAIATELAYHVARREQEGLPRDSWLNVEYILVQLDDIEKFIGQANQPTARATYQACLEARK